MNPRKYQSVKEALFAVTFTRGERVWVPAPVRVGVRVELLVLMFSTAGGVGMGEAESDCRGRSVHEVLSFGRGTFEHGAWGMGDTCPRGVA